MSQLLKRIYQHPTSVNIHHSNDWVRVAVLIVSQWPCRQYTIRPLSLLNYHKCTDATSIFLHHLLTKLKLTRRYF